MAKRKAIGRGCAHGSFEGWESEGSLLRGDASPVPEVVLRKTSVVAGGVGLGDDVGVEQKSRRKSLLLLLGRLLLLALLLGLLLLGRLLYRKRAAKGANASEVATAVARGVMSVVACKWCARLVRALAPTFLALVFFLTDFFLDLVFFCSG